MSFGRLLYWLFTGALLGFGLIGILSIGIFFLLPGVVLLGFGAARLGSKGAWALLVGFGALPALILMRDITSGSWVCIVPGEGVSGIEPPGVNHYTCVDSPFGQITSYHVMAFGFAVLALVGLAWPFARWLVIRVSGRDA